MAERLRTRHRYLLVDEYQDTNAVQQRLVDCLVLGGRSGRLTVVGDDDQSIYLFRGADPGVFKAMEAAYRIAGIVHRTLQDNRRSTPNILAVAAAVLRGNTRRYPKTLRAAPGPHGLGALGEAASRGIWV